MQPERGEIPHHNPAQRDNWPRPHIKGPVGPKAAVHCQSAEHRAQRSTRVARAEHPIRKIQAKLQKIIVSDKTSNHI